MHILLTGSTGFIGHTVARALTQAGHTVHGGVSPTHRGTSALQVPMDFAHDTNAATWLPRLQGIDAVVNAVGVLRDTRARPIDAVHRDTPIALFNACAQAGVQRVVHISALGIEGSATRYAQTKLAAERHLLSLTGQGSGSKNVGAQSIQNPQSPQGPQGTHSPLSAAILRPSAVYGKGGDSSALFMNLARLPVALFPGPVLDARVQPVSGHDLADAVVALLGPAITQTGVIECTGPAALTMGAFIASLRQQLGHGPAKVLRMPQLLTHLSARAGDAVPASPWCSETLAMLGNDNVGNPAVLEQLLGRPAVHYSQLVASAWR